MSRDFIIFSLVLTSITTSNMPRASCFMCFLGFLSHFIFNFEAIHYYILVVVQVLHEQVFPLCGRNNFRLHISLILEISFDLQEVKVKYFVMQDPWNCVTMHQSGVVSHLLRLIGSEDEDVQEAAADCLQNIRKLALACEKFRYQHLKT